jgi:protein KRI1
VNDKYGSGVESHDEYGEDSESEDEDGEELTPAMDVAILKTLAKIKNKDPEIYDSSNNVFEGFLSPPT